MTPTEFLLARIEEDEAVARAVLEADYSEGRWNWESHAAPPYRSALMNDRRAVLLPAKHDDIYPSVAVADHIVRHDPAHVLAECAAKRAIVEMHTAYGTPQKMTYGTIAACEWPCPTLHTLAAVYADHPDYDEKWKP